MINAAFDWFEKWFEGVQFRDLDAEFLRELGPMILEIIRNPSSNVPAAILILVIVTIIVLMIGSFIWMAILGDDEDDEEVVVSGVKARTTSAGERRARVVRRKDPLRVHKRVLAAVGVTLLLTAVTGYTTQSDSVCKACHAGARHFERSEADPHRNVNCVRCHESAGAVGSVTLAVPTRVAHIVSAMVREQPAVSYPAVTGTACRRCHGAVLEATSAIEDRALRVSHKEPVAAGARCLDCHLLDSDQHISRTTVGMAACIRCHNDRDTSAECTVCHTDDVSKAVLASRSRSAGNARELVPNPNCYTCHDPKPCDACHGVRLPHPPEYASKGHMRDAATSLWRNGGKTCFACHTQTRRSCYTGPCHEQEMPLHTTDGSFRITHQKEPVGSCDGCHNRYGWWDNACQMCHPGMR